MKDDRLPKMLAEVDEAIALQRDRVLQLDEFVIQHFASFADVSSQASSMISTTQLQLKSHMQRIAFDQHGVFLGAWLVEMWRGKLQRLRDGPPPEEEVAGKIHALLHLGVPMEIVKAGVDLLGEMPFSTRLAEQGHAVSAGLRKWHRKYTSATMMARSVVSSTKQLVDAGVARLASQRTKALDRVAMLRRKQPSQCHGRQAFVGSPVQEARPAHSSEEYDRIVRPRLMKEHAEKWQALSREEREDFVNRANQIRDDRQQQKREMIQAEVGKIRELDREILDEQARGQSLRMSACSWGEAQKADFENLYRDDRWSPSYVKMCALLLSCQCMRHHSLPWMFCRAWLWGQVRMEKFLSGSAGCVRIVFFSDLFASLEAGEGGRGGPLRLLPVHLRYAEPQVRRIDGG